MSEAIGQILPLALVVALSPIPIIGVVLMLSTPRARSNGPAFVLGWVVGLTLVGALLLVIADGAGGGSEGQPAGWATALRLALGALLIGMAARKWRGRTTEESAPKWMHTVEEFHPQRAAALAVGLSVVNPKNLVIVVAAVVAIAQTGIPAGQEAIAYAVFVLIATLGPGVPVAIYLAIGERSERVLGELRRWMSAHNAAIMAAILLLIGVKLIGDGISAL